MNVLVPIVMFGWIPLSLVFWAFLPARRALLATILIGWMFLPVAAFTFPGFPDYTKASAVSLAALLGAVIFDARSLLGFRPRWFDIPMLLWCAAPLFSSISNELGFYDG